MPDLSYFPKDKQEISFYLSWDKYFPGQALHRFSLEEYPDYKIYIFSCFLKKTYVVSTH